MRRVFGLSVSLVVMLAVAGLAQAPVRDRYTGPFGTLDVPVAALRN